MSTAGVVVAGFDGSEEARLATVWAAGEAASRGCRLVVVDVVVWPAMPALTPGPPLPPSDVTQEERALREQAEGQLAAVAGEVGRRWPNLEVETRLESGRAAETLTRDGADADLVVIGSSGRTGLSRMLLGSTAAQLVHSCPRPVVVVRHVKDPAPADGGRVVVGVDGSPTGARAVGFAFDFAERHGHELVAVHAWSDLPMDALEPVRAWDYDWHDVRDKGERLLHEALAGHHERHPNVPVRRVVSLDRPTHALLEHAENATLLVVGSHGRGALRSVLLGSVSHAMLYHAPCPVAILRATTTA
jgi:nucleotide-binding universal stress UspA family protein